MRKKFLTLALLFCSALTLQAVPVVTPVEKYEPPALSSADSWTLVLVPDTQTYAKFARNQGIGELMFAWIAENVDKLNIKQVLMAGDLVDQNRSLHTNPHSNDQTGPEQWQAVSRFFSRLDGVVPYVISTGNHDYGTSNANDRDSEVTKYFPVDRNSKWENVLVECGPNTFGRHTLENAAYRFTAPGGQSVLIVSLQFSPTDTQLKWAGKIFAGNPDSFGILLTHAYIHSSARIDSRSYLLDQQDGNIGEDIFQKLVRSTPNIRLVLCGHVSDPDRWEGSTGLCKVTNDAGKTVYEMLFDPQAIGGGWSGNGGDGWLRLLEFSKDMKTIRIKTFSPLFAISPSTRNLSWHTDPINDYTITYTD